jgi:hypothetical protein
MAALWKRSAKVKDSKGRSNKNEMCKTGRSMKETPRRRITVTSFLTEISTDQLGNMAVLRGDATPPAFTPFYSFGRYLKTT